MNSATKTMQDSASSGGDVSVTHSGIDPAALDVPDFPMLRVDAGQIVDQQAAPWSRLTWHDGVQHLVEVDRNRARETGARR
ncbi:hypothetical protein [Nocardia australiensis]|uniref:hypothetical protein n=1 Tax=Nocardia australiensis TaxID=2887191 RepID=UPI001D1387F0|nr:hypothetical protein [Nocardia australiensis]